MQNPIFWSIKHQEKQYKNIHQTRQTIKSKSLHYSIQIFPTSYSLFHLFPFPKKCMMHGLEVKKYIEKYRNMQKGKWLIDTQRINASFKQSESIDFQFCSSPVSTLGVVPNFVIGFVAEPVGEGSVLPLLLAKSALHKKGLVSTHVWQKILQQNNQFYFISHPRPKQFKQDPTQMTRITQVPSSTGLNILDLFLLVSELQSASNPPQSPPAAQIPPIPSIEYAILPHPRPINLFHRLQCPRVQAGSRNEHLSWGNGYLELAKVFEGGPFLQKIEDWLIFASIDGCCKDKVNLQGLKCEFHSLPSQESSAFRPLPDYNYYKSHQPGYQSSFCKIYQSIVFKKNQLMICIRLSNFPKNISRIAVYFDCDKILLRSKNQRRSIKSD